MGGQQCFGAPFGEPNWCAMDGQMKLAHQKANNINDFMTAKILDGQMEMAVMNILKTNNFLDGHFLPPKGGMDALAVHLPMGRYWGRFMDAINNILDEVKSLGLRIIVDGGNLYLKGAKGSASKTIIDKIRVTTDPL
jgi:hypothetical protein